MISKKMQPLMANNSAIRTMFEEGDIMKKKYGEENVYDFSLGNPNVPAPPEVKQAILDILEEERSQVLHGYMSNAGFEDVRESVALHMNKTQGTDLSARNIVMTAGAAGGINVALKTILDPGEEVIIFKPYFLEYNWYVNNFDGKVVQAKTDPCFQPDLKDLENKISEKTRVLLLNSPNNPTGAIYSEETIKKVNLRLKIEFEENGT